jgi:hypothetical protein
MSNRTGSGRGRRSRWAARIAFAALVVCPVAAPTAAQDAPTTVGGTPAEQDPSHQDSITSGGEPLTVVNGQLMAVVPFAGGLALPVKVGTSGARMRGETATATSATLDLGLLGELGLLAVANAPTLQRLGIDTSATPSYTPLPRPVTADSRDEQTVDHRVALDAARLGPVMVGGGHEVANAPEGGPATSRTELGDLTVDLGVARLLLAGGVAATEATAAGTGGSIAFGEIVFEVSGNPLVVLRGIEWRVTHGLGADPVGSFTVGSASIARVPFVAPGVDSLAAASAQINAVLAPAGMTLSLPMVTPDGVTPLRVEMRDSPLAFQYVNPVYSLALADAVNQAEEALVGGVPETGLAVTVANVVLAALTGRGGAAVDIGGLTTSAGLTPTETFTYAGRTGGRPSALVQPVGVSPPSTGAPPGPRPAASPTPAPPTPSALPAPATGASMSAGRTIAAAVAEELPGALVLAFGAAGVSAAWLVDRRRIREWAAQR